MLRRNVLIFHAGALGDFVLTWPVALAVARVYAQSRVFYVTAGEKGKLAEKVLGVEARDSEGGWQHLFGDPARLPDAIRRTLEGTQLVLNFVAGEGDAWTRNVRDVSRGAEVVTVRPRPAKEEGVHVSQYLFDQLAGSRVLQSAVGPMIRSVNEKGAGTAWKGGDAVVVHPGSGSREKCWPVGRWVELIRELRSAGQAVRVVMGEVERERFGPGDIAALQSAAEVRWPATYADLLSELSTAGAFVGNDSGPGHLAGMIGVPTVSIFGRTDPAVWQPMGPRVRAVRAGTIGEVSVEAVRAALNEVRQVAPAKVAAAGDED